MKKLERIVILIDERVDHWFGHFFEKISKHFSLFSSLFFMSLIGVVVLKTIHYRSYFLSSVIEGDMVLLAQKLQAIDKDCTILAVTGQRVPLNFLTVKTFVGANVGGLSLARPQRWQGPYHTHQITLQQQYFDLVQNFEGLFILPGNKIGRAHV